MHVILSFIINVFSRLINDEIMRAMVYEGVSGVSDKRGSNQCNLGDSDLIYMKEKKIKLLWVGKKMLAILGFDVEATLISIMRSQSLLGG